MKKIIIIPKRINVISILLIIVCFFSFSLTINAETEKKEATFVRCVDGDTAVFLIDEKETKFRFLAIDTPETVHPTKEVEIFGKNASEYTCNKLTNATYIVVEYEKSNKVDKYGRSLAWIWVDGSLLQKELVEVGYAEVAYIYGKYKYTESLCVVQQGAKDKGIWLDGRKEGYCATLDLTNSKDTINEDYDATEVKKETKSKQKSKKDEEETKKELEKTINSVNDALEKYNDADITNILLYVIIGAAVLVLIRGKKQKK